MRRKQIFISNRKEILYIRTYFYQYTPPSPVRTLYGRTLILYMMYFFSYILKIWTASNIPSLPLFISFCAPQKKNSQLRHCNLLLREVVTTPQTSKMKSFTKIVNCSRQQMLQSSPSQMFAGTLATPLLLMFFISFEESNTLVF